MLEARVLACTMELPRKPLAAAVFSVDAAAGGSEYRGSGETGGEVLPAGGVYGGVGLEIGCSKKTPLLLRSSTVSCGAAGMGGT